MEGLVDRITDCAGMVEEPSLSYRTGQIAWIGRIRLRRGVEGVCGKGKIGLRDGCGRRTVENRYAAETGQGDRGIGRVAEEIILGGKGVAERESLTVVKLLIAGERRGRVSGPNGGCLAVEFCKGTTTFA